MRDADHAHDAHDTHRSAPSLDATALAATLHCLTGCAIGEVLGLVLATALGWGNAASIAASIVLAFAFGYALTLGPLLRAGIGTRRAVGLALASDTFSIATMEAIDSLTVLAIPGAMAAGLTDGRFWASLAGALLLAFVAAYPVNRWLIARGRGHAVVHAHRG